jgi:hypothetical protein
MHPTPEPVRYDGVHCNFAIERLSNAVAVVRISKPITTRADRFTALKSKRTAEHRAELLPCGQRQASQVMRDLSIQGDNTPKLLPAVNGRAP